MQDKTHEKRIKICHIVTSHLSFLLFRGQIKFFKEQGFEVWGVSGPGPIAEKAVKEEGLEFYPIEIKRSVGFWGDIKFLVKLYLFLRKQKFDIVESGTAKAGMLGMITAWLARTPVRVYTLRGAWYDSYKGVKRRIASLTVAIPCALAHRVFSISHGLTEMNIRDNAVRPEKSCVVASGSSNGVDIKRFSRNEKTIAAAKRIRDKWQIPQDAFVIGFVGRASIEKGVRELAEAFEKLYQNYDNGLYLLFIGPFDYMGGMLPEEVIKYLQNHSHIKCVGAASDVENYYAAMDILAMPSYREGFGNVNIEAASMGVPVVGSDIYGCRESISDGHTGVLVESQNTEALYQGFVRLLDDGELRKQLAVNGPEWAAKNFDNRMVWDGLLGEYLGLYRKIEH